MPWGSAQGATQDFPPDAVRPDVWVAAQVHVPGYRIESVLGRGGMGVVYKAVQEKANRPVALKMILAGAHADRAERFRFRAEAEAAARLSHPNIVQLYEVGDTPDGFPYFSLEYVAGGSLAAWLRSGPLTAHEAAALIEQLAAAMQYAHEHRIVHRDLKPANILLTTERSQHADSHATVEVTLQERSLQGASSASGRVSRGMLAAVPKISDFGLAKQLDADDGVTRTGAILGTGSYMAPEQAFGQSKHVGPAADIYALGVILYECLTGRPPFKGASPAETLQQVRSMEAIAIRSLRPDVPRDLETICLKCLAKAPHKRYGSAGALADDLRRFLDGRPIAARPVGRIERSWRWCRRNPAPTALLCTLLLGTLTACGLSIWALIERDRADVKASEADAYAARVALLAKEEAEQRRRAEIELAHALVSRVRELSALATPGWTWTALDELSKARKLNSGDLDPIELRGLVADCLARPDVREVAVLAEHLKPGTIAFDRDGKRLAIGENRNGVRCAVQIVDVASRKVTMTCDFSNVASGLEKLIAFDGRYQDGIVCIAFSPDGKWLVAGTRHGKVCRWDTTLAAPKAAFLQLKGEKGPINCLAFSPDGDLLLAGSRDKIMRWDLREHWTGSILSEGECSNVGFTPDGATLAISSAGVVKLFAARNLLPNTTAENRRTTTPEHIPANSMAISPDGRIAAVQHKAEIRLVDLETGRLCGGWRVVDAIQRRRRHPGCSRPTAPRAPLGRRVRQAHLRIAHRGPARSDGRAQSRRPLHGGGRG
jgi:serine/threonine protein kinase